MIGGITRLNLAIYEKDPAAYGIGFELVHRYGDRDTGYDDRVYYIGSMYEPREKFNSKNEVIYYSLAEALRHVDDADTLVIAHSTELMFYQHERLRRKVGPTAGGRVLWFKPVGKIRLWTAMLATDAIRRKSTIIMPID